MKSELTIEDMKKFKTFMVDNGLKRATYKDLEAFRDFQLRKEFAHIREAERCQEEIDRRQSTATPEELAMSEIVRRHTSAIIDALRTPDTLRVVLTTVRGEADAAGVDARTRQDCAAAYIDLIADHPKLTDRERNAASDVVDDILEPRWDVNR